MSDIATIQTGNVSFQNINPSGPSGIPSSRFDSGQYSKQKYNEIYHDVDLYLCNSGNFDSINHYFINPAAVLGLHISDTVNNWIVDGSLTFMYLPEGAPKISKNGNKFNTNTAGIKAAEENGKVLNSYQFRVDVFDLLKVKE